MTVTINIQQLPHAEGLSLPSHATLGSAGADLYAAIHEPISLLAGQRAIVPTGIIIALPENYEGQVRSRSGLAAKHGIAVLNSPGTIDSDYTGEIKVILHNFGQEIFNIERGMRVAQLVIARYEPISWIPQDFADTYQNSDNINYSSARGDKGFGSTGI